MSETELIDEVIRLAAFSADDAVFNTSNYFAMTGAEQCEVVISAAIISLFRNGVITITEPETWDGYQIAKWRES